MSSLRKPTLVVSSQAGWRDEPPPLLAYDEHLEAERRRYIDAWTIVKSARFNASKRFDRKQMTSTFAFATAGVVGFILPYFLLTFGSLISDHGHRLLDFVNYATGLLALVLGLIEQARDYQTMSRRLNSCGREVNAALRKLRMAPAPMDLGTLNALVAEYEAALERCDINHDDIDTEIGRAAQRRHERIRGETATRDGEHADPHREWRRLKRREFLNVWGLYVFVLPVPSLVAAVAWWVI